jgi:hypothetical protein
MGRIIKIRIEGRGDGTDAPVAEDLLDQIRDYLEILRGVEEAIAEDGENQIVWRIVNATRSSPFQFELEAYARHYGTDVTRRVTAVASRTAEGLAVLQARPERPQYFTDDVLKRAERIYERVTNGLSLSDVDFGADIGEVRTTAAVARSAAKNAELALKPIDKPYNELGSVEGIARGVDVDGHGRRLLNMRHRLTGENVKCILRGRALEVVERHMVKDVFQGLRVIVYGTIRYRSLGNIFQIEAADIVFATGRDGLPGIDDILDESFTGGLRSEEYLERLRDGRLS